MKKGSSVVIFVWALLMLSLVLNGCKNNNQSLSELKKEISDESSASQSLSQYVIEVDALKQMLDSGQPVTIIEVSKRDEYDKGHIQGAFNLWRPDYENQQDFPFEGMRANRAQMEKLLGSLGVTPDTKIVVYEAKGGADAVRLLWILHMYGHADVAYLNGGKTAWKKAGYPLTQDAPATPSVAIYSFSGPTNEIYAASIDDVKTALNDSNCVLLDTRAFEEFAGVPYIEDDKVVPFRKGAYTFGRIPGAVHLDWIEMVDDKGDRRFIDLEQMRKKLAKVGVTPEKKVITYCQSGVRSAHTTFVLTKLLGYPNVKNYDGSWIEWSYHYKNLKDVPIERNLTEKEHKQEMQKLELAQKSSAQAK